jgi:hypothetical protein
VAQHVPGIDNVLADSLSRSFKSSTEWRLHPSVVKCLFAKWDAPNIDLFASSENAHCLTYVSWKPDPRAFHVDALSLNWSGLFAFSTDPSDLKGDSEVPSGETRVDSRCPVLAEKAVVPSSSEHVDRRSDPTSSVGQTVDSGQGEIGSSKPGSLVPGGMEVKRRHLQNQGLSQEVADTILAAKTPATYRKYESSWNHYTAWCGERDIDPTSSSVPQVLDYLQYCLSELNLATETVRTRVYPIALYHRRYPLTQLSGLFSSLVV